MEIAQLIEPHFQPIVSYKGHYAYEALLRFKNSEDAPLSLIAQWERSGYIAVIDRAMVRKVAAILTMKPGRYRVAVNVSAKTIEVAQAEYLYELRALKQVAHRVIVEVTETYPIADLAKVAEFAAKCQALSIHVALDDCKPRHVFVDLPFVRAVKPRFLKLDGQLLERCYQAGSREPIRDVVRLAQAVDAIVIAEWIDSPEKRDYAEALGASMMQGFWIARPVRLGKRRDKNAATPPFLETA